MNQPQPSKSPMTPREVAKQILRPYVLRGDSVWSICYGGLGWANRYSQGQIRGQFIEIQDDDWKVIARYKVAELYHEIQAEFREQVTQGNLFDTEAIQ